MTRYRAAVVGCGRIGSAFDEFGVSGDVLTHAGAYAACASTDLVALCDTDEGRARAAAAAWRAPHWVTDVGSLLEVRPEIVSVCSPDETHEGVILKLLAAKGIRAILAEKPLATTVAAATRLKAEAERRGISLAVNYSRRYAPTIAAVSEALRGGAIGDVTSVIGYYGKGLLHNGSHWIDLLRYLVGEPVWLRGEDRLRELRDDPSLDVELLLDRGVRCYLRAIDSRDFAIFEMDIIGSRGRVRLSESGHRIDWSRVGRSARYAGFSELISNRSRADASMERLTVHAVEDLVASLEVRRAPRCTASDGIRAATIVALARESARRGHGIPLAAVDAS